MTKPVKALILSGGGARGAYEAGVVDALSETESFDIVCGTSIGALNGLLVAQGMGRRLAELWGTIATQDVTRLRPELAALMAVWDAVHGCMKGPLPAKPLHAFRALASLPKLRMARRLQELRGCFDSARVHEVVARFADLHAMHSTFIVGVTNLSTARGNAFAYFPGTPGTDAPFFFAEHDAEPITAENLVDAVCASAALPPAFEPVSIRCRDGAVRVFADGGFTNIAPLRQAIDAGANQVTAIFVDPLAPGEVDHKVSSVAHIASLMLEANTSRMLDLDLKLAARINDDVVSGIAGGKRHVSIRIIRPEAPIELPVLDFSDAAKLTELVELGRRDGARARTAVATA